MDKVKRSKRHMTRGDMKMVSKEVSQKMQDDDVEKVIDYTNRFNKLRSDSGNIEYSDTLTTFFYLLMRDYLPAGKVEKLVNEVVEGAETCLFTNGFLAQYADNLANFMKEAKAWNAQTNSNESSYSASPSDPPRRTTSSLRKNGPDSFRNSVMPKPDRHLTMSRKKRRLPARLVLRIWPRLSDRGGKSFHRRSQSTTVKALLKT